jgi:branched-chain amino acid transport system permease protein
MIDRGSRPLAREAGEGWEGGAGYAADHRIRWTEWLPWVLSIGGFFLLPDYLALGARILIYIVFAVSLDLILGYAGIITLGHSAFFGLGAYVTGILSAKLGLTDPMLLMLAAAGAAAVLGLATGAVILRTQGLTQLMLTLAIASVCLEIANKATSITGGADGLSGVVIGPIVGAFKFDLYGKTAYVWCLVILFGIWWLVRRIIYSPFGAALRGIRENRVRMHAIGAPVYRRLVVVYTLSATIAGLAGALLTQTSQFVGLNVLGFEPSGELLVMLILGGVGRLYGAFIGPVVYLIAQDFLAKQFPEYWYFGIGLMLIGVVLFARGGLLGIADMLRGRLRGIA